MRSNTFLLNGLADQGRIHCRSAFSNNHHRNAVALDDARRAAAHHALEDFRHELTEVFPMCSSRISRSTVKLGGAIEK